MDKTTKASFDNDVLEFIDRLEREHSYKVCGQPWTYSAYNEAWCDALDRVRSFVENYQAEKTEIKGDRNEY